MRWTKVASALEELTIYTITDGVRRMVISAHSPYNTAMDGIARMSEMMRSKTLNDLPCSMSLADSHFNHFICTVHATDSVRCLVIRAQRPCKSNAWDCLK